MAPIYNRRTDTYLLCRFLAASVLCVVFGQLLQYMLIVQALFVAAAVLYGSLYWLVMPLRLHEAPLYFDYSYRGKTVRSVVLLI